MRQPTGDGQLATGDRRPVNAGDAGKAPLGKGADIAERLMALGAAVIELTATFPRDRAGRHIADQLIRSATAAGANYDEARMAESKADFVHKLSIAAKEIREAWYWTSLVNRTSWRAAPSMGSLVAEAQELAAILGASLRTVRSRR
jgi:four helix bundle protein